MSTTYVPIPKITDSQCPDCKGTEGIVRLEGVAPSGEKLHVNWCPCGTIFFPSERISENSFVSGMIYRPYFEETNG